MLLVPDQGKVRSNQRQQDTRNDEHVCNVQTVNDDVTRVITVEHHPVQPGTDDRETKDDGRHNTETNT